MFLDLDVELSDSVSVSSANAATHENYVDHGDDFGVHQKQESSICQCSGAHQADTLTPTCSSHSHTAKPMWPSMPSSILEHQTAEIQDHHEPERGLDSHLFLYCADMHSNMTLTALPGTGLPTA